jgi:large subunit ribosomal protein L23|tara:strand:+ start:677 stop:994 length:318 start_codon:yes stop_codon:yes gene_type:complete
MANVFVYPRATEKAYAQSQDGVYVFNVPLDATKNDIAESVEKQYDVTVVKVKTVVQSGKAIRYNRGARRYPGTTNRKDTKKAYVTLAEGNSIQVFAEQEQQKEEK